MQPKTLKILGGALLILMAVWAALQVVQQRQPQPKTNYLWEKAKDAKRLVIRKGGKTTTLVKSADGWSLETPFKFKADGSKVEDFLGKLAGVSLSDVLSADPGRQEYFQVTSASGVFVQGFTEVASSSPAMSVVFGKQGADYDSIMLRRADDNAVVEGRGLPRYDVEQEPGKWVDKTVAKIEAGWVKSISLRSGKESLELKRAGENWKLSGSSGTISVSTTAVSGIIQPMLAKLGSLDADEMISESEASSTTIKGLRSPEFRIVVRYLPQAKDGEKILDLAVGPKDSDFRCPVRKKGVDGIIYKISSWQLDPFRKKAADFKAGKAS